MYETDQNSFGLMVRPCMLTTEFFRCILSAIKDKFNLSDDFRVHALISLRFKRHWGWDQYYYNGRYGHRRWHYGYDRYMDRGMGGHIGGGSNNNYGGTTIDRLYNYNINL
ncbi:hypothetical protein Tcan_17531 [Toxocara canis]|uniref:Uncharacterized protein n=1 Tax=Toxocara canis TaxID=6265 RepID=A0A0B2USC8_TOXCA|nr:hypothetical protein Tcan_17531 [Toxocara canis]